MNLWARRFGYFLAMAAAFMIVHVVVRELTVGRALWSVVMAAMIVAAGVTGTAYGERRRRAKREGR